MTWEEMENELARWEKMLREINEFFEAVNKGLKGERNATDKKER